MDDFSRLRLNGCVDLVDCAHHFAHEGFAAVVAVIDRRVVQFVVVWIGPFSFKMK